MSDPKKRGSMGSDLAFCVWPRAAASPAAGQTPNSKLQTPNSKGSALVRLAILVAVLAPTAARACTVCMGDSNSNIAGAANGAIFLMIGTIATMLAALSGFGFYLYKRASAPIPPHIQLDEEMGREEGDQSHA